MDIKESLYSLSEYFISKYFLIAGTMVLHLFYIYKN